MTIALAIVAIVSLVAAALLRAAGTAIARVPRADALRDASDDVKGAREVAELLEEREVITPAVGMVTSALLVVAAVAGMAAYASELTVGDRVLIAVIVGVIVFLVGDLVPRLIGRRRPARVAYRTWRWVRLAIRIGGWATDLIADPDSEDEEVAPVHEPDEEQERELIDSVLEFGETVVREVMTPRPDMVTIGLDSTIGDLVSVASEAGYSRVPVVDSGDVVGMVIVKDLLPLLSEGLTPTVAEVMRPVEFIPDSKLVSSLLGEMQESHVHQMIVVDEYGDVAGLVTIEDLLEELVGEIADETDEDEVFITPVGDRSWTVDARLPVEDLADTAGIELPDEDWDTVGGLVLGLAERVPEEGEAFTYESLTFTVTRMQGRRVSEVAVAVSDGADV